MILVVASNLLVYFFFLCSCWWPIKTEQRERSGHALPYWTAIPLLCARSPEIQLGIASLEDLTEESLGSEM